MHHDDVIKWKHFPRYWLFVRGIHRSPVNSQHKDQWRGAFMFSLICAWINRWVNNSEADDLRRYRAHYDVIVMHFFSEWCIMGYGPVHDRICEKILMIVYENTTVALLYSLIYIPTIITRQMASWMLHMANIFIISSPSGTTSIFRLTSERQSLIRIYDDLQNSNVFKKSNTCP